MRAHGAPKQPVIFSTDVTEKLKDQKKTREAKEIAGSSKLLLEESKESQNSDYSED